MTIAEKVAALAALMKQHDVQAYIVPSDDDHGSEYVGDYYKARKYMSGFTGSAGTFVLADGQALLWTDGRYFLQAEKQLAGTPVRLMKDRQPGVPSIGEYLYEHLPEGARVGIDGRTMTGASVARIAKETDQKQMTFVDCPDLVGQIWQDRPPVSKEPVWELDVKLTGLSRAEKLARLRAQMKEEGADVLLLTALEDVAWTLNLRGGDIAFTPVFLSYMLITEEKAVLYVHEEILSSEILGRLAADGVTTAPYDAVSEAIAELPAGWTIWYDGGSANYRLTNSIPETVCKKERNSPVVLMRAVKTPEEMANIRTAHIKDGVAVTRFIHWLKTHVGKETITELDAAAKLLTFRSQMEGFLGESFAPIMAYGPHGAIVHYDPTPESDVPMEPKGFCLADTGGHYQEGSTDITRTIALGLLTDEEKRAFTLVLKGHLNLAAARFIKGVCGQNLDILARQPLWEHGLDYNHGTGHGVGYLMSVHEGPHNIHWRMGEKKAVALQEGMIISDEPGLYIEGKFGIRHENLVLVRQGEENACGQFLYLETLTKVPFDKEALDLSLMTETDIARLNAYHAGVYAALAPYMEAEELVWLKEACAPVKDRV